MEKIQKSLFYKSLFLILGLMCSLYTTAEEAVAVQGIHALKEVRISGTVMDRNTHSKLKSVSITVPNTNISTVTNSDGFFLLKLKDCPERIMVSALGYKKQSVMLHPANDAGQKGHEKLRILMTPSTLTLPELNVWQNDPEALVKAAIDRVEDNFVQTRELHTSFYRETLQKGSRFIDISEAILTACKRGYGKGINYDRVKVEHGRHIVSQRTKDTLSVKVQGGPMTAINYDAVKNADMLFNDIQEGSYSYAMEMPEELDGRTQIVISFYPRIVRDWVLFSGKIYLDRQTLAFTRIEISLDMSNPQKATQMLLVKKPMGLRFKPQELTTVINYRDGRINYMRTNFRFKCDWKKRLFYHSYTSCSEMVVTDFTPDYDGPNIDSKERFSGTDILTNEMDNFSDPDFWKEYNIIEPTENLEKAINKLRKH